MKLINLTSKLVAISLIFIAPSIIVIKRYTTETSQQMVESTSSIGLFPAILISASCLMLLLLFANALKQSLRESKFGWLAIMFFGLVLGTLLFGVWFIFHSLLISLQMNVEQQMAVMDYHRKTVFYMLFPIIAGISVGGISKLLEIDLIKKFFTNLIT